MNRQIYKMTISDTADSITFYLLDVPIVKKNVEGTATNTTIDGNVFTDYMWLKDQWEQKWSIMCNPEWSKLDAIYKRQFSDADVPTLKVFYGDNIYTDGSAEGSSFKIMNDSEVYEGEIRGFSLYGNATQFTTTGKNLFGASQGSRTDIAVASTIKDGVITLNGTTSGSGTIGIGNQEIYYTPEGGDTYTFTIWLVSGTATFELPDDCGFYIRKPDGTSYASGASLVMSKIRQYGYQSTTFTAPSATPMRFLISANKAGIVFNNVELRVQIEKGSTKTDWEEYTAGASPNPSYPQDVNVVSGAQTVIICGSDNTLSAPSDYTEDRAGLIFTCTNGVYNVSGQSSGGTQTSDHILEQPYIIRDGDYLHLCNDFTSTIIQIAIVFSDGTFFNRSPGNSLNRIESMSSVVGKTAVKVRFYYNPNYTIEGNFKPMILNGISTATAYEPYQGQSYEINLGGNLFDRANATENQIITWTSGDLLAENKSIVGDYISASEGQQFSTNFNACVLFYDSSKTYLGSLQTGGTTIVKAGGDIFKTFTIPNGYGVAYMRVEFRTGGNGSLDMTQQDIMLNYGSTALPYAPYTTYAYELAKIGTYQDYIYKSGDKWYKHAEVGKVVLDGTEAWGYNGTDRVFVVSDLVDYMRTGFVPMSDYYTGQEITAYSQLQDMHIAFLTSANSRTVVKNTNYTTANDFKTWLGTHKTTVYYALATPTDIEITDAELVGQLNALLAGSLYKGTNNIFLIPSAGADGTMTLDYRIDYEKETVVQYTMPVKLDLTDGGIINACLCRQNVQVIMRETVK